jgi:Protein of unknown function (DUF2905)
MPLGRMLIIAGAILLAAGLLVTLLGKFSIPLGRLPGDIRIQGKNTSFYFPLATCLLLSLIFSLVLRLLKR